LRGGGVTRNKTKRKGRKGRHRREDKNEETKEIEQNNNYLFTQMRQVQIEIRISSCRRK
jgi:hypothetical protein